MQRGRAVALAGVVLAAVVTLGASGVWQGASAGGPSMGDANCDQAVDSIDAARILQYDVRVSSTGCRPSTRACLARSGA